jgi:hypothetical protein
MAQSLAHSQFEISRNFLSGKYFARRRDLPKVTGDRKSVIFDQKSAEKAVNPFLR